MLVGRTLPVAAVRPRWSSASFLFYLGTYVLLLALSGLIAALTAEASGHRDAVAVGWSALVLAVTAACALLVRRRGHALLAGLGAVLAVAFAGVFVAALVNWAGLEPTGGGLAPTSFEPGLYLVELALIAAALAALHVFEFPLLVLVAAAAALLLVVDVGTAIFGEGGSGVPSTFALLGGLALAVAAVAVDRSGRDAYGLWLHVVAGLGVGAFLLDLTRHGEGGWILVAIGSLLYVAASRLLGRSSWAVLGAVGVLAVSTHWIERWVNPAGIAASVFGGQPVDTPSPWKVALAYVGVGIVLVGLGLAVERPWRRAFGGGPAAQEPPRADE